MSYRKGIAAVFVVCLSLISLLAGAGEETLKADMRALGKIEATCRPSEDGASSWTTLAAEDAARTGYCASKLIADLTGFGDVTVLEGSKLPGTALVLEGTGQWIIGLDGAKVQVLFAKDAAAIPALAEKANARSWKPVALKAHPRWLDRFDNDTFSFGFLGFGELPYDVRKEVKWLADRKFNIAGECGSEDIMIAPGVFNFTVADWYSKIAANNDLAYLLYLTWVHARPGRPKWVWNKNPLPHVIPADPSVGSPGIAYRKLDNYTAFAPINASDFALAASDTGIARHTAADPNFNTNFGAAELCACGIPDLELVAGLPETKSAWITYLKTTLGLDLKAVGTRYKGSPAAYPSWDKVEIPSMKVFAGWNPDNCLNLNGDWQAKADKSNVGEKEQWFSRNAAAEGWSAVRCDDPMLLLYQNEPSLWLRKTFTAKAESIASLKFLHTESAGRVKSFDAYLNGRKLKNLTVEHPITGDKDQCFEIGDALVAGENLLVMNTHGAPINAYVFIGPAGRWHYLSDNPFLNRLWFDGIEFSASLKIRSLETSLKAFRAGDPNGRPTLVMAPHDMLDLTLDLYEKYGAFPHCTGQSGACWAPWVTRYALTRGTPISSEPGGPPRDALGMRQMISLWLLLGDDSVNALFDPSSYRNRDDISAWIDSNREMIRCLGKMEMGPADVGVMRSLRDASRLHFEAPWSWDVSRGELQSVGRTVNLVDPFDMVNDKAGKWFKVIMDAGSELLTDAEIAGIERFVKEGGTFIAIHETGKHSPDTAFSWPISKLTGLKVVNQNRAIGGKIRFTNSEKLWPSLKGREINAWGMVYDWKNTDQTGDSLGMEATDKDVEVIAEWVGRKEGEGKIAVAVRRLGKGMILTMGSSFWRSAKDEGGRYIAEAGSRPHLAELLDSLQVTRNSSRDVRDPKTADLFAEHWRSKNGLYDLYVAAKVNNKAEPTIYPVTFTAKTAPTSLRELSADGHPKADFKAENGSLTVDGVTLDAMQTRVYAAPREDIAKAPLFWLKTLEKRWHSLTPVPPAEILPELPPATDVLPLNEGWTICEGGELWGDTPQVSFDWKAGRKVKLGAFINMGIDRDDTVAHLRKEFILPPGWKGQRTSLVFGTAGNFWGVAPHGRLWIDGKLAPVKQPLGHDWSGALMFDVTPAGTDGRIVLEIEVDGRVKQVSGRRPRPSGVTGFFYLKADPQPLKTEDLKTWMAASDIGAFTPATVGTKTKFIYLETKFILPAQWPSKRIFLESPKYLGFLVLNGHVVETPIWMNRLDISGMVRKDGGENVLRWAPGQPSCRREVNEEVPNLKLAWWPTAP